MTRPPRFARPMFVFALMLASGLAACGTPRSDDDLFNEPSTPTGENVPADGGTVLSDGAVVATDSGQNVTPEAGADGGATNAFTGAGAYQNMAGNSSRKGDHNFAGNTPTTNPAKQACLGCHGQGGGAPRFLFGGTVYADANGQVPASNIEVALRDGAGAQVIVRTDQDGNFYRKPGGADPTFPAQTAARNGAVTRPMNSMVVAAGGGDCNGCHKAGAAGVIHVP
ncbi:MAG: hypothetical protein U0174_03250 [Polyangiaceae bacterium]